MVPNSTLDILNAAKDLDIEYNIKLIVLSILVGYSLILLFLAHNWEAEELWQKLAKLFMMQIPSYVFIIFSPLTVIYLFREVSWEIVYGFLIAYYVYLLGVALVIGKLGLYTAILSWLGIETKVKKIEMQKHD